MVFTDDVVGTRNLCCCHTNCQFQASHLSRAIDWCKRDCRALNLLNTTNSFNMLSCMIECKREMADAVPESHIQEFMAMGHDQFDQPVAFGSATKTGAMFRTTAWRR